ncbi:3712_t:CDS:2, partial [Scutellospora calospora]
RQKKLLIGNNTIQVWDNKKLDFICIINKNPYEPELPYEKFQVTKIRLGPSKFDIILKERNNDKEIRVKIEHEDDIINIVRNAIDALTYLYSQSKSVNLAVGGKRSTFNEIVKQTRNIIKRFISLYPNVWRLLDFRYKLMLIFIELKDFSLIAYILFGNKNLSDYDSEKHISSSLSVIIVNDNESDIKTKLKSIISKNDSKFHESTEQNRPLHSWLVPLEYLLPEYHKNIIRKNEKREFIKETYINMNNMTMLTYFLEYYSTNAMNNIGWMNIVNEIIPILYEINYGWYVQEFFYNTCFGNKRLDSPTLKFHEIKKRSKNSLKVFIPVTQLIPHDNNLELKSISDNEIPYIRMVPLINLSTNKDNLSTQSTFKKVLIKLFLPGKYSSIKNEDYSPFIRLLKLIGKDDVFYEIPSMEAIMTWMWYSSKYHWRHTLQIYVIYLLTYSIISWAYIAHLEITGQAPDTYDVVDSNSNSNETLYTMVGEIPDNPFSNLLSSIVAVYGWDSIPLDSWNFWPLVIINVIGGFLFVIVFGNIIISFMGDAFSNAERASRRGVLKLHTSLIYDYACLEGSSLASKTSNFDILFKDKLNVRYICFLDEQDLTREWKEKSKEIGPRWLNTYSFSSDNEQSEINLNIDEIDFIWTWKGKKGRK